MPFNWSTLIAKAKNIQFFPSGNTTSTDVQGAIEELDNKKANISQTITDGVTDKSPSEDAVAGAIALLATLNNPAFTGTTTVSSNQNNTNDHIWSHFINLASGYGSWGFVKKNSNDLALCNGTGETLPNQIMTFLYNGNVGFGTTSPTSPLNVMSAENTPCANLGGNLFYYATDSKPNGVFTPRTMLSLYAGGTNGYVYSHRLSIAGGAEGASGNVNDKLYSTYILSSSSDSDGHATKTDIMTLRGNGNVGIGTTDPKATLHSTGSTIIGTVQPVSAFSSLGVGECYFEAVDDENRIYISEKAKWGVYARVYTTYGPITKGGITMAIQATITTIQGIQLTQAYINLQSPQIQKAKTLIPATETEPESIVTSYKLGANACVYANKDAYDAGKIPVEGFSVVCDIDLAQNVMEQGYAALKLSDRLSNVEDLI